MRYFILERASTFSVNFPQVGPKTYKRGTVYPVGNESAAMQFGAQPYFTETDAKGTPLDQVTPDEKLKAGATSYVGVGKSAKPPEAVVPPPVAPPAAPPTPAAAPEPITEEPPRFVVPDGVPEDSDTEVLGDVGSLEEDDAKPSE